MNLGGWEGKIGDSVPYKVSRKPLASKRSLTNLIPMRLTVYDVEDVEGFVNDMVLIAKIRVADQHERDEIVGEGIVLLLHLARNFKPKMEGYEKPGKFSGYCAAYLPRKISTAWHKLHPEHLQETQKLEDGRTVKRYKYGEAPMSLGAVNDESGDGGLLNNDRIRTIGDFVR